MPAPDGFTWVDPPLLAATAQPASEDEYQWLRGQNVQLMVSLCEDPPPRKWLNDAGLFSMVYGSWAAGEIGSAPVTVSVEPWR